MPKKYDQFYYEAFILALLFTFLPFKALGILTPLACLFWFLIRSKSGLLFQKLIFLFLIGSAILILHSIFYSITDKSFYFSNGFISFLHYSTFIVVLLLPSEVSSEDYNYEKYAKVLLFVLLIEGIYGIGQRFLSPMFSSNRSGDIVEGTINPLSFIQGTSGFGNQYFAINMVFILIFCFPFVIIYKKKIVGYLIAIIALVLASVGHVFFSLILAVVLTFLIYEGFLLLVSPKRLMLLVMIPSLMLLLLANLDSSVLAGAKRQADMFLSGKTPKSQAVVIAFNKLSAENPEMHLIGLGPGQYSSRAGLIASGHYGQVSETFRSISFFNFGMTDAFRRYVLPAWKDVSTNLAAYGNSTMYRPVFSWLSVYTEFGGIVFFLLLLSMFKKINKAKKVYQLAKIAHDKKAMLLSCSFTASVLFLFFIGIYENYYETPQGIFVGLLLILLLNAILNKLKPQELKAKEHSKSYQLVS